jgi:polyhydroxybutyrate depolymerase
MRTTTFLGLTLLATIVVGCGSEESSDSPAEPSPAESSSDERLLSGGDFRYTLTVDGLERTYIVHVPDGAKADDALPVVLMLHGAGGTAAGGAERYGWNEKADEESFLAVYADASRRDQSSPASFVDNPQAWNDGSGRGQAGRNDVDDVGFINALLHDLISRFGVDEGRLYVTGFSSGASMTYRLGVELADRVAAIAPVSGQLWLEEAELTRPVPMLSIAGEADPLNPLEGGEIMPVVFPGVGGAARYSEYKPPIQDSVDRWAALVECPAEATALEAQAEVTAIRYGSCAEGSEVLFYIVDGMGHVWPGATQSELPGAAVGPFSNALDATSVIWEFFESHPRG